MDFIFIFLIIPSFWFCFATQEYEKIYLGENQNIDKNGNGTFNLPYNNLNDAFKSIDYISQSHIIFYMMEKMEPYYLDTNILLKEKTLIIRQIFKKKKLF